MEKELRRRAVRRQQLIEVSVDNRSGTDRRVRNRRTEFDRRKKQTQVQFERRTGRDQRTFR